MIPSFWPFIHEKVKWIISYRLPLILLLLIFIAAQSQPVFAALSSRSGDALHTRVRTELANFTDWLAANNVQGYIGEMGWPNNEYGDSDKWNLLADTWFDDADAAQLWVTSWATGLFWTQSYRELLYKKSSGGTVDTPSSQSAVLEAHLPTSNYKRGVNVAGGEFGVATDGSFSNQNPGVSGTNYFYDPASTFTYLASRGYNIVRLPIRWERIQPNLNSPLSTTESARLQSFVSRAGTAGLGVILDIHNYAEYWLYDASSSAGVKRKLGSLQLPQSTFTDLWTRLSSLFKNDSNVIAYDLMNEPYGMPGGFTVGATRATFDSTTEGWVGEGATSVSQDTITYNTGGGALKATKLYGSGAVVSRMNDGQGASLHDISANGLSLSAYVFVPSANTGTGWQARIEVQKPDFTYATGTAANLTKGVWTNITYTMTSTVAASMRAVVVQFSANNVNATASAYVDDITQGTSQTAVASWDDASQAALNAIRANGDTKLIMVPGYNHSGAQSWTTNNPSPWITDSANNFRYEAHHYWDSDNSGAYSSDYATTLAAALSSGYSATGTSAPTGSFVINAGSSTTTDPNVTLTLSATDDADVANELQIEVSNLSDFSDATWAAFSTTKAWSLPSGLGTKTVYLRYRDSAGNVSSTSTATITVAEASTVSSNNSGSSTSTPATCSNTPPGTRSPTLYAALPNSSDKITVYFTDAEKPFDTYYVRYGTSPGNYAYASGSFGGQGTRTYSVQSLSPSTTYYFQVRAGNGCATGGWSNEISTKTYSIFPLNTLSIVSSQLSQSPVSTETTLPTATTPIATPTPIQTQTQTPTIIPSQPTPTPTKGAEQTQGYSLTVHIVNEKGESIPNATVVLHSQPRTTTTDANGTATFTNVEKGQHKIYITSDNMTGEQSLYLSGEQTQPYSLEIKVQPTNPFASTPVIVTIAILSLGVIGLLAYIFITLRKKRTS